MDFGDLVGGEAVSFMAQRDRSFVHKKDVLGPRAHAFRLGFLDELLHSHLTRAPLFRITRDGRRLPDHLFTTASRAGGDITSVLDPARIEAEYRRGATLTWHAVETYLPLASEIAETIARRLGGSVEAVLFATPPNARGYAPHFDADETFMFQLFGTKSWRVWSPLDPRPASGRGVAEDALGPPDADIQLERGDLLYVPWGAPHCAQTGSQISVHLTIALRPPLLYEAVAEAAAAAARRLPGADKLALPAGVADRSEVDDALRMLGEALCLDSEETSQEPEESAPRAMATDSWSGSHGLFAAVETAEASFARSDSKFCRTSEKAAVETSGPEESVRLKVGGRVYQLPGSAAEAVERICRDEATTLAEIAEMVGNQAAERLLRQLVFVGVVEPLG